MTSLVPCRAVTHISLHGRVQFTLPLNSTSRAQQTRRRLHGYVLQNFARAGPAQAAAAGTTTVDIVDLDSPTIAQLGRLHSAAGASVVPFLAAVTITFANVGGARAAQLDDLPFYVRAGSVCFLQ